MGLDNGIRLKTNPKYFKLFGLRDFMAEGKDIGIDEEGYIDVTYERKWWGYRNDTAEHFEKEGRYNDNDLDQWMVTLSSEDIKFFIKLIDKYDDEETWEDYNSQCWFYEEVKEWNIPYHKKMLKRLLRTLKFLERMGIDYDCYWYDSY